MFANEKLNKVLQQIHGEAGRFVDTYWPLETGGHTMCPNGVNVFLFC